MRLLFTICARAGSKGLKNKNLKLLNGIPLVYYTLAAIRMYVDKHPEDSYNVALNTDSNELTEIIKKQKIIEDIKLVPRRPEYAGDSAAKVLVIQDTYRACDTELNIYDYVIDLDLTSPFRTCKDIENAIEQIKNNEKYDLVFSVVGSRRSPYFNMVELKGDGFYRKVCESEFTARQQVPLTYELNASIYVYRKDFLIKDINKTLLDYNCGISVMKDYLILDIDSEEDYFYMEKLFPIVIDNDIELKKIIQIISKA